MVHLSAGNSREWMSSHTVITEMHIRLSSHTVIYRNAHSRSPSTGFQGADVLSNPLFAEIDKNVGKKTTTKQNKKNKVSQTMQRGKWVGGCCSLGFFFVCFVVFRFSQRFSPLLEEDILPHAKAPKVPRPSQHWKAHPAVLSHRDLEEGTLTLTQHRFPRCGCPLKPTICRNWQKRWKKIKKQKKQKKLSFPDYAERKVGGRLL